MHIPLRDRTHTSSPLLVFYHVTLPDPVLGKLKYSLEALKSIKIDFLPPYSPFLNPVYSLDSIKPYIAMFHLHYNTRITLHSWKKGILIVRGGWKEVWEERPRPPNSG
ncbi:hypothetical protein VP01_2574g1 [Puccinia sorghi]|uniref:Tc1-like transposase DDE domain-containing protein n=1 Tax=Puccinia sorghi TaxID=27349 RepID=A0A0L6V4X9_9BASI|nr:hypothetical protein VP01_2574g1 [Puccinia sorghi]